MIKKICLALINCKLRLTSSFKLRRISSGERNTVYGKIFISHPQNISIGSDCFINDHAVLNGGGGIKIGNDVTISSNALIISSSLDVPRWIEGIRIHKNKPIIIGNRVWICAGAIILPGVEILGEHVIIGAGAVVTKSIVDSNCVVAGNPAKIVKRL